MQTHLIYKKQNQILSSVVPGCFHIINIINPCHVGSSEPLVFHGGGYKSHEKCTA